MPKAPSSPAASNPRAPWLALTSWASGAWASRRRRAPASGFSADPTLSALRGAAIDAQRSRLPQMAAALTYRTLFGLLPMAVVALLVVRGVTTPDTQADIIKRALEYAGLSQIKLSEASAPTSGSFAGILTGDFVGPIAPSSTMPATPSASASPSPSQPSDRSELDPSSAGTLESWITSLVTRADASINFRAIGIVGIATLIYAALSMLVEIERAFNQIYRVPRGRSWVRRVTNYWTLLTLGAAALIATFYVGLRFKTWVEQFFASFNINLGPRVLSIDLAQLALTVPLSTGLLLLAYKTVPNTRVKTFPALAGAALAAVIWEVGKTAFTAYLEYSTSYARLYGSIALIPLFMLWIYVTWCVVLFGLEVAFHLQHGRHNTRAQPLLDAGPTMIEPASSLSVMVALARSFHAGKQASVGEIARATGLSEGVTLVVLGPLLERGLVVRIEQPDAGDAPSSATYMPVRPPSNIDAAEVLQAGFHINAGTSPAGGDTTSSTDADLSIATMRSAQLAAVKGKSVADLAELANTPDAAPGTAIPTLQ